MGRMVHVLGRRCLDVNEAEIGQQKGEYHEKGHNGSNTGMLQFADVALVQLFQFVVFETVRIQ